MAPPVEGAQAKEALRMIQDFRNKKEGFFSKGYLNSDGKRAMMRLLSANLQIAYDCKGFALKRLKKGSEMDTEAILTQFETRLNSDRVTFKYRLNAKARTHE